MATILTIDDDPGTLEILRETLERAGHQVVETAESQRAFKICCSQPIDLVIADIYMPVKDGFETILQLLRAFPDMIIIAISGAVGKTNTLSIAKRFGATETLTKPFTPEELLHVVKTSLTFA